MDAKRRRANAFQAADAAARDAATTLYEFGELRQNLIRWLRVLRGLLYLHSCCSHRLYARASSFYAWHGVNSTPDSSVLVGREGAVSLLLPCHQPLNSDSSGVLSIDDQQSSWSWRPPAPSRRGARSGAAHPSSWQPYDKQRRDRLAAVVLRGAVPPRGVAHRAPLASADFARAASRRRAIVPRDRAVPRETTERSRTARSHAAHMCSNTRSHAARAGLHAPVSARRGLLGFRALFHDSRVKSPPQAHVSRRCAVRAIETGL